jgi:Ca2+-binding RTX toxin-like protein
VRCHSVETLERRAYLSVTATFQSGTLTVLGDSLANTITVSRNASGTVLVNGGAVSIQGGPATVANTAMIQAFGQGGNDTITLNEANGALPRASLFGGADNDILTGGSGADQLFGQAGNDTMLGKGGNDLLFGGDGNDVFTGGDGDDQCFGQSGDDRTIWNPGDDTDLNEGGDDIDTVEINGGNGAEVFTVAANGTRVRVDRVSPAPFSLDIGTTEKLTLNANGGDDNVSAGAGLAGLISITFSGGAGNDTLSGGDGDDVLLGNDGDDVLSGNAGNDVLDGGAGVNQLSGGDGDDSLSNSSPLTPVGTLQFRGTIDGGLGIDGVVFYGSDGNDHIRISRRVGPDGPEMIFQIGKTVSTSLYSNGETVTVFGGAGNDHIAMDPTAGERWQAIFYGEGGNDHLSGSAQNDTLDGGPGNDMLEGGGGDDLLISGK